MPATHASSPGSCRWVHDDPHAGLFKVHRDAFISPDVFQLERKRIFDRCWLFVGHESELKHANDFLTRNIAGRELIFNRDRTGRFHAFFNTCPHRGAMVAREKCGNALGFKCFYHGWGFNNNGRFATRNSAGVYPETFGADGSVDLTPVPHLASHRGFFFVNFDQGKEPESLTDYLADAAGVLDLVADHSPSGMEIVGGAQEYSINANWKLLVENSYDGYHAAETHETYFDYLLSIVGPPPADAMGGGGPDTSRSIDLGHGSAMIEGIAPWGRPIGRAIPAWGSEGQAEIDGIVKELTERLGEERALRIATRDRNIGIFPNLVINDIMAVTVRTFFPVSPDHMRVQSFALAPVGESPETRKRRLDNFLEFLGPGGFATPDDVEALESAQRGYGAAQFAPWNDISRGMLKDAPVSTDEEQMRTFWRQWARCMEGE